MLLQVEGKGGGFIPLEEIPEDLQAGSDVQFPSYGGKLGKVGNEVGAYTGKIGAASSMVFFATVMVMYRSCTTLLLVPVTLESSISLYSFR